MKLFRNILILAAACAVAGLTSCSSGLAALNRGDYFAACTQAVNRLRSDPGNEKAVEALSTAYPYAVGNSLRQIENILDRRDVMRIDQAIDLYKKLNSLADDIYSTPAALQVIPNPRQFHSELGMALDTAAEAYYSLGLKALGVGSVNSAREALTYFRKVQGYRYGYRDIARLIEDATYKATLRVVVLRPATPSGYQISAEFFYTRLMNDITRRTFSNLVRFYTPEEAQASKMNDPHQLLALDFETFSIANPRETSKTIEVKRDSVVIGQVRVDGRNHDVYGTVKARYTVHLRQLVSTGALSVRIIDAATNRTVQRRSFDGTSTWTSEWATFNGDERALSKAQFDLTHRKPMPPPPPQEVFAAFADPLYSKATSYISSVY